MTEVDGVVVAVESGDAWLKLSQPTGGCGRCDEPGGCRAGLLQASVGGQDRDTLRIANRCGVSVGDRVRLTIQDGMSLQAALLTYGVGTVLLLLGAIGGRTLAGEAWRDVGAALGMLAGVLLSVLCSRLLNRSRHWRSRMQIHMEPVGAQSSSIRGCVHEHD